MGPDWRIGSCLTEDVSKLYKAQQEIKLPCVCFRAVKGALRPGVGRIDVDFSVPVSSCAIVGTCFMSSLFPLKGTVTWHGSKLQRKIADEFLPETGSFWELAAILYKAMK